MIEVFKKYLIIINYFKIIGLCAGACTTFASVPQIIKIWQTQSTEDISLVMYVLASVGSGLWIAYGILKCSLSLIVANTVGGLLAACLLLLKLKFDRKTVD